MLSEVNQAQKDKSRKFFSHTWEKVISFCGPGWPQT
jgi:hypothetical protein